MAKRITRIQRSAALAARSAVITTVGIFALVELRALLNVALGQRRHADWQLALELAGILGLGTFLVQFLPTYLAFRASGPADAILSRVPSVFDKQEAPFSGFVAMEYYALFLNRT